MGARGAGRGSEIRLGYRKADLHSPQQICFPGFSNRAEIDGIKPEVELAEPTITG